MRSLESETYHLWRPGLDNMIQSAIRQRSVVTIQSHMPLDECNTADVILIGRFLGLTGQQTQFVVENFDLKLGNSFPKSPECEYSFAIDEPTQEGNAAKIEYGGRALIIDQELQKNNLPEGLLLRMSQPVTVRKLRMHARYDSPEQLFTMPGLLLIDNAPESKRKLLTLLGNYYQQKGRPKPDLVDISAGGACIKSNDSRCHRFLGTEESYLFFFFSKSDPKPQWPHVFVGKKVGIFRVDNSRHAGLRIRFLRELVWDDPEDELKWIEIDATGSKTIDKMLQEARNLKAD